MFCDRCGHNNSPATVFCTVCEQPLDVVDDPTLALAAVVIASEPMPTDVALNEPVAPAGPALVVRSGSQRGARYVIAGRSVRLGRHPDNDIVLDDITVSRHHVAIEKSEAGRVVSDLHSLNGTYVNQARVDRHALRDGDEIQVGKFRLVYLDREHGAG